MSKLPKDRKFIDLSDYGRPVARWIANSFKDSAVTPVHVTWMFVVAGFIATFCILNGHYWAALFFLTLKSTLDAADGELSRVKNTPSYTGRYLDSVWDIILNFIFLLAIWKVTGGPIWMMIAAFLGIQLQGTLYNYYYVILRNIANGDTTSRIFEVEAPTALPGEKQSTVNLLFAMYNGLYILFDKTIYYLDRSAVESDHFPKLFMTLLSTFGLGFQLLIMGVMLALGWIDYIIPFFIIYSALILVFILARKIIIPKSIPSTDKI